MYCENCGKKIDKDSYTCPECGYVLDKKQVKSEVDNDEKTELQRVNTLFIIGFVLSLFCGSIFGLLLTIAGFVSAKRFKEDNDKNVPLVKLGIASVIIFILSIVFFVCIFVFSGNFFKEPNKYVIGKWNCGVEDKIEFTDEKIIVTLSDKDNKLTDGTYSIYSTRISNGIKEYKMTINPSYDEIRYINARVRIKGNNTATITLDTTALVPKVYSCVRE